MEGENLFSAHNFWLTSGRYFFCLHICFYISSVYAQLSDRPTLVDGLTLYITAFWQTHLFDDGLMCMHKIFLFKMFIGTKAIHAQG